MSMWLSVALRIALSAALGYFAFNAGYFAAVADIARHFPHEFEELVARCKEREEAQEDDPS